MKEREKKTRFFYTDVCHKICKYNIEKYDNKKYNKYTRKREITMDGKMKRLGKRLSELRKSFGFTQENVAEYLNVDQSLVSKIEKGERNIDVTSLEALADLYLVSVEDLTRQNDKKKFNVSFRKDKFNNSDITVIARINRIVLNQRFMDELEDKLDDR